MANEVIYTLHLYQVIFQVDPFSIPRLGLLIPNELGQLAVRIFIKWLAKHRRGLGANPGYSSSFAVSQRSTTEKILIFFYFGYKSFFFTIEFFFVFGFDQY